MVRMRRWWMAAAVLSPVGAYLAGAAALMVGCGPRTDSSGPSEAPPSPVSATLAKTPIAEAGRADFVGSPECVTCHTQYRHQLETHHYHTLATVEGPQHEALFRMAAAVVDSTRNVRFAPLFEGGQFFLTAEQGGARERVAALHAFGSGNRCFTYLGSYDGEDVELRISYFGKARRWDFTPGQQPKHTVNTPVGRKLDPGEAEDCYNCHTTAAVVDSAGKILPEKSIFGVGCESCHGPGRAHVEAAKAGRKDLLMADLSRDPQRITTELCGSCHRTAETGGDPHDPTTQSQLPRLQGPALALSRCFKESQGRLGCVTCHDPHRDSDKTSRAEYNRICASCHRGPEARETACPTQPRGDCVGCHMPMQQVDMPTRPSFSTHWIKVWRERKHARLGKGASGGPQ